jgi:negative regulator of genetic competence, sporulation and motility
MRQILEIIFKFKDMQKVIQAIKQITIRNLAKLNYKEKSKID